MNSEIFILQSAFVWQRPPWPSSTACQGILNPHPLPRFKLTIEYAGTRYSGWQIQKNARTIQGEIDRAVRTVTGRKDFELYGSGRTDAGVHALAQVAHLDVSTTLPPDTLRRRVNDELPTDINILSARRRAAPLPRAPRRGVAPLPVSDRPAADGVREGVRVVGEGAARRAADAAAAQAFVGMRDFRSFTPGTTPDDGRCRDEADATVDAGPASNGSRSSRTAT